MAHIVPLPPSYTDSQPPADDQREYEKFADGRWHAIGHKQGARVRGKDGVVWQLQGSSWVPVEIPKKLQNALDEVDEAPVEGVPKRNADDAQAKGGASDAGGAPPPIAGAR